MQNLSGRSIKGYELRDQIGSGGFGAVYRAYQASVRREVAIKVILGEHASNPDFVRRFEVEAQLIARMEHPYIVPLYDYWQDAQGAFLVMRLLPSSLRTSLKRGPWDAQATARLLDQIAGALGVAHRAGIVHRDIKPDNILLDEDSNAYLTDFGIAKDLSTDEMTQEGVVVGSPAYLTPEQIKGEKVTPASDIYSLGLVVYEMLAGSKPYTYSTTPAELMFKHLNEGLPALRTRRDTLPAALNEVLQTATAKAPADRYASAVRFADAFRATVSAVTPISSQPLPEPLTERELDILVLMVEGLSNKEVAAKLYLTLSTVRWYVQQIYTKLDAHSRGQAIERARNLNLVGNTMEDTEMQKTSAIQNVQSKPASVVIKATKALTTEQRNRARMLEKVRTFWVEGILENSLHGAALLELGMKTKPEAVERAWDIVLQQDEQPEQNLPHGTRIADVFDEMDGELLILGDPGSGKTTTLLELARDLISEAETDERQPMPTVFNLSSWAGSRKPIQDWLIDELNSKYQIPRKVGQAWIEADQILPLLDGLDEVKQDNRAACVEAINLWRQEHGFLPVVVCSRITDYEALSVRLRLRTAIVLQPLTIEQIDQSLVGATEDLSGLRGALHNDASLQSTPLMLSIVTLTYRDMPDKTIFTSGTPEARNAQIFNTYIDHALKRRGKNQPYKPEQTVRWLSWLAKKQQESGQSVFYIENMQPRLFLETQRQRFLFSAGLGLVAAAFVLPVVPLLFLHQGQQGMDFALDVLDLQILLSTCFGVTLFVWLSFRRDSNARRELAATNRLPFTWLGLLMGIGRGLIVSLVAVAFATLIAYGAPFWLAMLRVLAVEHGSLLMLLSIYTLYPILSILIYGILDGVTSLRRHQSESDIKVSDAVVWSWRALWRSLVIGLVVGLAGGLILGISLPRPFGETPDFHYLAQSALSGSEAGALMAVIFGGFVSRELEIRIRPNQGMWRTGRNAIRTALIRGLLVAAIAGVIVALQGTGLQFAPGIVVGTVVGGALVNGGMAVVKHLILRLLVAQSGNLPLNLARFLDYASDTILLRKVGGGYVYIHRMLLEHFAAMAPGLAFQKSKRKRVPAQGQESSQSALATPYPGAKSELAGEVALMQEDETVLGEQHSVDARLG